MLRRTAQETTVPNGCWPCCWRWEPLSPTPPPRCSSSGKPQADDTGEDVSEGGGVRLVLRLARRPIWLAGLACDGVGYGFQAVALGVGELLVVQPVITSGILFALPAEAWWAGRRIGRGEFAWACVLAAGLAVFLLLADTSGGKDQASGHAWLVCAAIAVPVLGVASRRAIRGQRHPACRAVRVRDRRHLRHHRRAHQIDRGAARRDTASARWRTGSRTHSLVLGGLGFVLNQRAFQAGSLTASLPTLTVVEPVVAAIIGITMLQRELPTQGVGDWIAVDRCPSPRW